MSLPSELLCVHLLLGTCSDTHHIPVSKSPELQPTPACIWILGLLQQLILTTTYSPPHPRQLTVLLQKPILFSVFSRGPFSPTKPFSQSTSLTAWSSWIISARSAFCKNVRVTQRSGQAHPANGKHRGDQALYSPLSLGISPTALRWIPLVRELLTEVKARTSWGYLLESPPTPAALLRVLLSRIPGIPHPQSVKAS